MELLDVLTLGGLPTGRTKPKAEIHHDGDWHRAAHLWLVTRDCRVLLQRRSAIKENWPNLWDVSVAGHISAGENAIDAAIREAQEEIGLALTPSDLTHLGTLRWHAVLNDGAYIENEFHEVFVAMVDIDIKALVLDAEEVAEIALVQPDEIERYGERGASRRLSRVQWTAKCLHCDAPVPSSRRLQRLACCDARFTSLDTSCRR